MRTSRRQFLARSAQLGVLLGAGVPLLNACGGDSGSSKGKKTDPIADGLQPEKGPLKIINYADYVNPDVISDFEKEYGVKVEISTIDTDTEAVTKLASGALKVDVHHSMASTSIGRLIEGGLIQPLNKSYLTHRGNVLPAFDDPWYDPGAVYSVPYTFFGTGIGYRADRIDPAEVEAQGWDTIWNATAFKGQVSVLDDEREAFTMAMLRKGITDINTTDTKIIDQALADVMELIDLVNVKVNIEAYKDIPEGTTSIAHTWSADLIAGAASYLPEGTTSDVLGFWHPPSEQYVVSNDSMGVLADAENPVLAHLYIDYLLDNDVAEKNFSWVGYLPALTKLDADYVIGAGYVPENLRSCVPTNDDITKGLKFKALTADGDALYEAAWSKFTAGG
ncbi:MAG: spermidine/putrescine ABC transporter substrate-binding protein [Acidimicrobiales bacterium]